MSRKPIALGQRFQEIDNPRVLWEVEFLYSDGHGIPHARLRDVNSRVDARTYSCAVILDSKRFRQVSQPEAPVAP